VGKEEAERRQAWRWLGRNVRDRDIKKDVMRLCVQAEKAGEIEGELYCRKEGQKGLLREWG